MVRIVDFCLQIMTVWSKSFLSVWKPWQYGQNPTFLLRNHNSIAKSNHFWFNTMAVWTLGWQAIAITTPIISLLLMLLMREYPGIFSYYDDECVYYHQYCYYFPGKSNTLAIACSLRAGVIPLFLALQQKQMLNPGWAQRLPSMTRSKHLFKLCLYRIR